MDVYNHDGDVTFAGNVTINGIRAWKNYYSGIHVKNKGAITFTNAASWDNPIAGNGYGADLDNQHGTGNVSIINLASSDTNLMPGFQLQP